MVQAGASIVGGCCGATPEHIAQTAQALKEPLPKCTVSAPKKLLKPAANASNSFGRSWRRVSVSLPWNWTHP
ncbi:MAG: homocysteine S-methyltransferase family protein [Flavonifractor plautii]